MTNIVKTAALVDSTPLVVPVGDMETPITVTLSSAAVGRLIELSTNGGAAGGWFTPTYDVSQAGMINIGLSAPVSHVRFTGAAADVWRVQ